MTKLPRDVSGLECVKVLEKIGFQVDRQRGSHVLMARDNPPPPLSIVVPMHKTIRIGMLRTIIRQAGLTVAEFVDLL